MEQVEQQVQEPVIPQEVVTPPVEPTVEGQAPSTTEPVEQTQVDPNEQFLLKTTVEGKEEIFDIRDPEQRKRAQEEIQKGVHYTRKMQSMTEWEKANQSQIQFNQMMLADPDMLKISVAKQNGLNPASLYGNPQPPDPNLQNTDPQLYNNLVWQYQTQMWERKKIEDMTEAYGKMQSDVNNNALFERARIENELNDVEFNQVKTFLVNNFRSNNYGMFSREQMDVATSAIVGKSRNAQQQMNTIKKIDQSIKQAAQIPNIPVRNRSVAPSQKDTDDFHKFVREKTRS